MYLFLQDQSKSYAQILKYRAFDINFNFIKL